MKKIFLMLILLLCLVGCSNENDVPASKELDAMDTTMSLTAYGSNAERALEEASDEIARLDKCFSISASSGDIWTLNNKKSATSLPIRPRSLREPLKSVRILAVPLTLRLPH